MIRLVQKTVLIFLLFGLGCVVHVQQKTLDCERKIHFVDKSPVFLPKGDVLKWMSMGYRGIVGDWLWIKSVLYYGRRVKDEDNPYYLYELVQKGELVNWDRHHDHGVNCRHEIHQWAEKQSRPDNKKTIADIQSQLQDVLHQNSSRGLVDCIYPLLDRVTTVDPHFVFPYIFGGVYLLMDTGETKEAVALLEKGYRANPEKWELPFYLGWVEWMYRNDLSKTSRYLMEAVGKQDCPDYVSTILAGLSRRLDQAQMTRLYLESLLKSTDNPEIEKRIQRLIQEIGVQN